MHAQANVNPTLPPKEWPLDALAAKMKQYCYLLEDITPELLLKESGGDYEELRAYLRQRGTRAYTQKVGATPSPNVLQRSCRAQQMFDWCAQQNVVYNMGIMLEPGCLLHISCSAWCDRVPDRKGGRLVTNDQRIAWCKGCLVFLRRYVRG